MLRFCHSVLALYAKTLAENTLVLKKKHETYKGNCACYIRERFLSMALDGWYAFNGTERLPTTMSYSYISVSNKHLPLWALRCVKRYCQLRKLCSEFFKNEVRHRRPWDNKGCSRVFLTLFKNKKQEAYSWNLE